MAIPDEILQKIPFRQEMIPKGDPRITPYLSDTLMKGDPDLAHRARDLKEIREILIYCDRNRIPVTFCGSRTCLTGASVAAEGLLVAMEQRNRLIDIGFDRQTQRPQATAEPGILLGEFQKKVAEAGYFYPPDPTSLNEAQLGGTVATNATGEDSLLYGPTRRYIRRLKLLLANGREIEITRKKPYRGPTKNKAGYSLEADPIDAWIGSEGTLGLITEITVDLIPQAKDHFVAWAFFPDLVSALDFVKAAQGSESLKPRALELIDLPSLKIIARLERSPKIPPNAGGLVLFKQEYEDSSEREHLLGKWLSLLERILKKKGASSLIDAVQAAFDPAAQERFRSLRHAVPSGINEEAARYTPEGGGKISTDWWVPIKHLHRMMREVTQENEALGVRALIYGHIGNGHPHINYVARNHEEKRRAEKILLRQCRRAVAYGGGVAGEHGLGKLHRHLLPLQCSPKRIEAMMKLKKTYDPHGILGQGNIFPSSKVIG